MYYITCTTGGPRNALMIGATEGPTDALKSDPTTQRS